MAKPNKKIKVTKPTENPSEPEQHSTETCLHAPEATSNEPPLEEHNISIEHMDVEPATTKLPSPIKPPRPIKPTEEKVDVVTNTGLGYTAPGNPTILSKHSAKEEISVVDKGKWPVNVESYAHYGAQEIHSGYLNRLHTSCDFEDGLVNLMKECFLGKYYSPLHMNILPLAVKFTGHDKMECTIEFK